MKIKDGFILRSVAGQHVVMPIGQEAVHFNGLIQLNETGKLLFEHLQKEATEDDLVNVLKETYEVDQATATKDVQAFINTLKSKNVLQ